MSRALSTDAERSFCAALLACSCVLLVSGCGSVGDPRPPLLNIPGRVEDFAAWQEGARLQARWTWPVLGSEGQIYRRLERFEVWAVDFPDEAPAPPADVWEQHGQVIVTTGAGELAETAPGGSVSVSVSLRERVGKRTLFAVRGVSDRGRAGAWSAPTAFHVVEPPPAPDSLSAEAMPEGVVLRWQAAAHAASYEVERRIGDGEFAPLTQTAVLEHLDRRPVWGEPHHYRVRGLRSSDAPRPVAGERSEPFSLTPEDRFPPAAPRELRAVATPTGVELSWTSNEELDLAGFLVLRDGERLNAEPLEPAAYSDRSAAPGTLYRYSVIAVDRLGNESPASDVVEVAGP